MDILKNYDNNLDRYIEQIYNSFVSVQGALKSSQTPVEFIYNKLCTDFGVLVPDGTIEDVELASTILEEISKDLKTVDLIKMDSIDLAFKLYLPFTKCSEEFIEMTEGCYGNYLKVLNPDLKYLETGNIHDQINKLINLARI